MKCETPLRRTRYPPHRYYGYKPAQNIDSHQRLPPLIVCEVSSAEGGANSLPTTYPIRIDQPTPSKTMTEAFAPKKRCANIAKGLQIHPATSKQARSFLVLA